MPTTIFTNALGTNRSDSQVSFRDVLPITAGAQSQVRVTFTSGTGSALRLDNASIGIQSSTYITTATPVELLFSGAHGFTVGPNASITSDWVNFTGFTSSDKLVVIMDYNSAGGEASSDQSSPAGVTLYYLFGNNPSYNIADPTSLGSWGNVPWAIGVALIETQATGGGPPIRGPFDTRDHQPMVAQ